MSDQLQKFMFSAAPVRGEIVSLRNTWQEVLTRRDYPAPVRTILGEMMAACALLSANLKFDGTLIMQIFGDGPVRMLVVQCSSDLSMRATAKFSGDADDTIGDDATLVELVNASGHGRCVITLDPARQAAGPAAVSGHRAAVGRRRPAQIDGGGARALHASLGAARHAPVARSQHRTRGRHAAAEAARRRRHRPASGRLDADTWERVCTLGGTLSHDELLKEEPETVFRRLFWQENVQHFEPATARFELLLA